MPETGIKFQDKFFHFGAYAGLSALWGLFSVLQKKTKALSYSFLATLILGIVLELIQEKVNPLRTYDILDLLSNCLGVIIGTIIVLIYFNNRTLKN
ncbi:VanZ family protein [Winogradskyella litorisediminis]|uniref:VanZ family protein n=2 Tax=Winogradskyella litorisediminis TaxID=1156618 RepID=A0ABW3N5U9_9FLAO